MEKLDTGVPSEQPLPKSTDDPQATTSLFVGHTSRTHATRAADDEDTKPEHAQIQGFEAVEPLRPIPSKSHSSPSVFPRALPPPPIPPMNKSRQRILQLTGHDTRYDRSLERRAAVIPNYDFESSSDSFDSEIPETIDTRPPFGKQQLSSRSTPLNTNQDSSSERFRSVDNVLALSSGANMNIRDIQQIPEFRRGVTRTYSTEPVTLNEIMAETPPQFPHVRGLTLSKMSDDRLVPAPLASPSSTHSRKEKKRTSLLADARDSMAWGIQEVTGAPFVKKELHIEESLPAFPPPAAQPKKGFSSTMHPFKSPSIFRKHSTGTQKSDSKFGKHFSGAMNRISGGQSPPSKTKIIPNAERAANGPDTPLPVSPGTKVAFPSVTVSESSRNGNEQLQEVYERAKRSLKIKSRDEKRRENLRKKIVVVGTTDQSPGMTSFQHASPESAEFNKYRWQNVRMALIFWRRCSIKGFKLLLPVNCPNTREGLSPAYYVAHMHGGSCSLHNNSPLSTSQIVKHLKPQYIDTGGHRR